MGEAKRRKKILKEHYGKNQLTIALAGACSETPPTLDSFYPWYNCTVRKDEYLIPGYVRFETANRGKELTAILEFPDTEKLALAGGLNRVERLLGANSDLSRFGFIDSEQLFGKC